MPGGPGLKHAFIQPYNTKVDSLVCSVTTCIEMDGVYVDLVAMSSQDGSGLGYWWWWWDGAAGQEGGYTDVLDTSLEVVDLDDCSRRCRDAEWFSIWMSDSGRVGFDQKYQIGLGLRVSGPDTRPVLLIVESCIDNHVQGSRIEAASPKNINSETIVDHLFSPAYQLLLWGIRSE